MISSRMRLLPQPAESCGFRHATVRFLHSRLRLQTTECRAGCLRLCRGIRCIHGPRRALGGRVTWLRVLGGWSQSHLAGKLTATIENSTMVAAEAAHMKDQRPSCIRCCVTRTWEVGRLAAAVLVVGFCSDDELQLIRLTGTHAQVEKQQSNIYRQWFTRRQKSRPESRPPCARGSRTQGGRCRRGPPR